MEGKLYGIGVGPGDPELMTLKALRLIKQVPVLAIPASDKESCRAYQIVKAVCQEAEEKKCIPLDYPMTKNRDILNKCYQENAQEVKALLAGGEDVAFITLGDPTIYSTYTSLHEQIKKAGFQAEIVNGIPSFLAIAAALDIPLARQSEELHIIPATYGIEAAQALKGTKILMKAGKQLRQLKTLELGKPYLALAENCGMPGERLIVGKENLPEESGYYTTVIIGGENA